MNDPKIIVALDFPQQKQAMSLIDQLQPEQCRLKIGKEMFTRLGPDFVETVQAKGFDCFLDLKYHDIPNTVAQACATAADLGVWMLNVHALGGRRMMEAAAEALAHHRHKPALIGVTVLTSMSKEDLQEIGIQQSPAELALHLAAMAQSSGLDGVVCSAMEAQSMRQKFNDDFLLVTPGIRPAGSAQDDQRRIMTPLQAMKAGSSYLVIGRPVTQARHPARVLDAINSEILQLFHA